MLKQSAKKIYYFVTVIVPKEIAGRLAALQRRYNLPPWEPRLELHVTLVSPFPASENIKSLARRLTIIQEKRAPFEIELDGFGRFDNEESVLFAKVKPNVQLESLANQTMAALEVLRPSRTHPFTPHITLAAIAPRTVIDSYFEQLAAEKIQFQFLCDRFALLCLDQTERVWKIVKEFKFHP